MNRRAYLALTGTLAASTGCVSIERSGPPSPTPRPDRGSVRCGDRVHTPIGRGLDSARGAWPTSHHDEQNTGAASAAGTDGCVRTRWTFRTREVDRAGHPIERLPGGAVAVDGTIYVTGATDTLYALDATSGGARRRYSTLGGFSSSPTVANGVLYFSSGRWLQAVDIESGRRRWADETTDRYGQADPTGTDITFAPTVVDGAVYVGSDNGIIRALDSESGARRWTKRVPLPLPDEPVSPSNDNAFAGSPAVADGVVYAANENGVLYALEAGTGDEIWTFDTRVRTRAAATVANGRVFMATLVNLHELDPDTGAVEWELNDGNGVVYGSPAVAEGTLYVVTGPSRAELRLTAIDLQDHSTIWRTQQPVDPARYIPEQASPSVTGTTVYLPVLDTLRAYDRETGVERWRLAAGDTIQRSPAVLDGLVCAVARDGYVYAVG